MLERGDDAGERFGVVVSPEQLLEGGDNTIVFRHVAPLVYMQCSLLIARAGSLATTALSQKQSSGHAVVDLRARLSVSDTSRLGYFQHCITCSL
jgi:hypothetical protein